MPVCGARSTTGSRMAKSASCSTTPIRGAPPASTFVETAWKYGAAVRCLWLETSLEQAQFNAVTRMVKRHGRLLSPDEIRTSRSPNTFPPEAQFRYRREL